MKKLLSVVLVLVMLAACASAMAEELTIYHSNPTDWCDPMIEKFTEETGITVNVVTGSTGDLAAKIAAESENTQADILWGGAPVTYNGISEYLQPYESAESDKFFDFCIDPNHLWQGFDVSPHVILYNTDLVSAEEAPTSWADLLDEKWFGKISQADPTSSSTALLISMIQLQVFGGEDGGYDYMTAFYKNLDGKISSSSSNVYKMVADGEFAIGVTYEFPVLEYMSAGVPVQVVYPSEGTYCSPSALAIIKDCPNLEAAQKFVDFVQSYDVQNTLAGLNKRSIRTDITDTGDLLPLTEVPRMDYDENWATEHREEFVEFWKDLVTE